LNKLSNELQIDYKYKSINKAPKNSSDFEKFELSNIDFKYSDMESLLFSKLTLKIKRGDAIAIIGDSGIGKTTLIDLILGLLEPLAGEISVNGKKLTKKLSHWYSATCYLPQQSFVIDDTLRKNITLTNDNSEAIDKKVIKALKKAKLENFFKALPEGLDSKIGQRGMKISGGQKQRLSLARAFYFNREVLILDEATNALDKKTEKDIISRIKHLKGEKTLLIIAHNLQSVNFCDKIYRLVNGKLELT
jgi:ABC-type transport system involved in cytochrome bd biosynthesis, fused ATPase and permease components